MAQFNPGGSSNQTSGPTIAAGTAATSHQFSGSVNISGTICLSTADNLSGSLAGPGSYLGLGTDGCLAITTAAGGGGGSGISWDGSTANGVATFKDSDEATVESKLTFDGAAELLSLTGAIIQTGSTATFFVAHGQEDAFVVSGTAGGFNPSLGLMNVDTNKQTVRFGGGVNIPTSWALNFGTLDAESNGEAKITYNGYNLILSGASSATRVTGSVEFANSVGIGTNHVPSYLLDVSGSTRLGTDVNTAHNVIATGSMYVGTPTSTTLTVNSGDGAITINANTGGSSGVTINGPTSLSGSDQYDVLLVEAAQRTKSGGDPVLVAHKDGVGIGVGSPKLELDVAYSTVTGLSANEGGGERVYFGTASGPTVAGALYYLNEAGGWDSASADATGSGNSSLLGISIGTDPTANGMLIRGFFNVSTYYEGAFATGSAVYIHSGASSGVPVKGKMSGAASAASNSYARIVGYGTSNYNVIYFNPGTNWVELS
jgi:hypothetical protein